MSLSQVCNTSPAHRTVLKSSTVSPDLPSVLTRGATGRMRANLMTSIFAASLLAVSVPAQEETDRPTGDRASDTAREHRSERARLRAYLRSHPRLFRALKKEADRDGDGRLSPEEREALLRMARDRMAKAREDRRNRLDVNDDGKVGPLEAERARRVHERVDRNDDGKVQPGERQRARATTRRRNN